MLQRTLADSCRVLLRPASIAVVLTAFGCGSSTPTQPNDLPPVPSGCVASASPEGVCPTQPLSCPRVRPSDARTVVVLSSCGFAPGEPGCSPIALPVCPSPDTHGYHFWLARTGDVCVGEIALTVEPTAEGGATVRWTSQELALDAAGECKRTIGPEQAGVATVLSSCCATTTDFPMNDSNTTFRLAIRADWIGPSD